MTRTSWAPSRRKFVAGSLGITALLAAGRRGFAQAAPRVVIVGGGFGGVSVARWLRRIEPGIAVTLIERDAQFVTCPSSNLVLGGLRDIASITFNYDGAKAAGVHVIQGEATAVDPVARRVTVSGGATIEYDRLVLTPGIQLVWNAIKGYDETAAAVMPHAWLAGAQTTLLRRRLEAMDDGGLVVIAAPDNPSRCPPGPYERASMMAWYLKNNKPKSKIMILDAKDTFPQQGLFLEAWKSLYGEMIEWVPFSKGGHVSSVDTKAGTVSTDFDDFNPAVANIIPPQRAGQIAIGLGLDQGKGFCSVDPHTFESTVTPGIHLVGDAILAGGMPRSGSAANSQAKTCARALASLLRGRPVEEPVLQNACYSTVAPNYSFTIAGAYRPSDQGLTEIPGTAGTSPLGASPEVRSAETRHAETWYANITSDMFGHER